MSNKIKIQILAGLAVTAVILYYSIKTLGGLHPGAIFHSHIDWLLTAVSIVIYVYANYIRALGYTRGIDRNIDRLTAFEIVGIGHSANMVLPLHAGEGLRFAFFPDDYNTIRRTRLLVIPAIGDFAVIMLLSVLAVPFSGFTNRSLLRALWFLTFLLIGLAILTAAAIIFVPRLHRYLMEYLNIGLAKMMGWVFLSWVLLLISTWFSLMAFGFHAVKALQMSLAVFAATNIINSIPASPGGIGLFEYGVILGLGGLGVSQTTSLAVGLFLHLIQYAALLPMGFALYAAALHGKYGDALKKMWRSGGKDRDEVANARRKSHDKGNLSKM